ncbi:MAG: hypothetical protein AAFV88_06050 [Planctomycetota bacterium]
MVNSRLLVAFFAVWTSCSIANPPAKAEDAFSTVKLDPMLKPLTGEKSVIDVVKRHFPNASFLAYGHKIHFEDATQLYLARAIAKVPAPMEPPLVVVRGPRKGGGVWCDISISKGTSKKLPRAEGATVREEFVEHVIYQDLVANNHYLQATVRVTEGTDNNFIEELKSLLQSYGQDLNTKDDAVGARTPYSAVAVFATGRWAEGGARSACPVLKNRQHAKVAIFTRNLTPNVVEMLKEVDTFLEGRSDLKWSFVFVSHENDPTPSENEFETMLDDIRSIAKQAEIDNLSIGLMKRVPEPGGRAKQRLGFVEEGETVVMLIKPPRKKNSYAVTAFKQVFQSADLNDASSIVEALSNSISKIAPGNQ